MYVWSWDPTILIGLALQAFAYLACIGPLRGWFPGSAPVPRWQAQMFLLGVLVLFIALVSPLSALGDNYLLTAHMIQHLLVTLLAPPLLLLGTPRWLLRPLVATRVGLLVGRALTHPVVAFLLYNLIFTVWHVPAFYERSLNDPSFHAVQHIAFIATATLTWWPIFSPLDELPRLPPGLQCIYLFVQILPMKVVGALLTFADGVLYPTYARAPRVWGLTPQVDQQLGALIMWIPGALFFFFVFTVVFLRWMNQDEREPGYNPLEMY